MKQQNFQRLILAVHLVFLAVPFSKTFGQETAISLGSWSFFSDDRGIFTSLGITQGLTSRLEAGLSIIPRMTPEAFKDLSLEVHCGYSIAARRFQGFNQPASYINVLADIGALTAINNLGEPDQSLSKNVFVRLTPIALGNAFYTRRDRIYSVGALFDLDKKSLSFFLNFIIVDFFIAKKSN